MLLCMYVTISGSVGCSNIIYHRHLSQSMYLYYPQWYIDISVDSKDTLIEKSTCVDNSTFIILFSNGISFLVLFFRFCIVQCFLVKLWKESLNSDGPISTKQNNHLSHSHLYRLHGQWTCNLSYVMINVTLLPIVFYVLLQYTASEYQFDIFKFLIHYNHVIYVFYIQDQRENVSIPIKVIT